MKTISIRLSIVLLMMASAGIVFGQPHQNSHHNTNNGHNGYHIQAVEFNNRADIREFRRISRQLENAFYHRDFRAIKRNSKELSYMMTEEIRESRRLVKQFQVELDRSIRKLHALENRTGYGQHGNHGHGISSRQLRAARQAVKENRHELKEMRGILSTQTHLKRDFQILIERSGHTQSGKGRIAKQLSNQFIQSMEDEMYLVMGGRIDNGMIVYGNVHGNTGVNSYHRP